MQFADFVAGQRQWLSSEEARESIGYWLDELRGCAAGTTIPYDDMPSATTGRAGARYPFALPAGLTAELTSVARRERVTVAALTMLALYMVVRDEAGVDDVVLGIPMGNRLGTDTFDAMGFLVNAHAVRMRMPAGVPLRELARTCARKLHGAMAHQQVPLPAVLAASSTDPAGGLPSALFRMVFTFHNEPDTPLDLAGTESCWWEAEDRTRRADLTPAHGRRGDRLAGDVGQQHPAVPAGDHRAVRHPVRRRGPRPRRRHRPAAAAGVTIRLVSDSPHTSCISLVIYPILVIYHSPDSRPVSQGERWTSTACCRKR
jgi:hypothetical protein